MAVHYKEAQRRYANANFVPKIPQFNVEDFKTAAASQPCIDAAVALGTAFQACSAFTTAAPALFNDSRAAEPTQQDVTAYCGAPCKVDFQNNKVPAFVQACTALEIFQFELADRSKGDNGFQFYKLIFILRLPCVQFGTDYCLPTFWRLVHKGANWQPTIADLQGICTPCLVAFFVEYVKYAKVDDLKALTFVDLLCTNSLRAVTKETVWCIVEFRAVDAMGDTDVPAKINRMCSTRCYQKILVKTYLAAGSLGASQKDKDNAAAAFKQIDIFCANNGRTYCGEELFNFNQTFNAPGGPVEKCTADFTRNPPLCGASCADAGKAFYNKLGCCFQTLLNAEKDFKKEGDTSDNFLPLIKGFLEGPCKLTTPGACFKAGKYIAARIVIRNMLWAYYLAEIAAVRAAILADLAVQIGARLNQIRMDGEPSKQIKTTAADGFTVLANEGIAFNIRVDSDGSASEVETAASQFQESVSKNQVVLTQSSQLPYNSREDPASGLTIDVQASTVTTANGAGQASFSLVAIVACIVAVLAFRA